jgi:hypothetical protein
VRQAALDLARRHECEADSIERGDAARSGNDNFQAGEPARSSGSSDAPGN